MSLWKKIFTNLFVLGIGVLCFELFFRTFHPQTVIDDIVYFDKETGVLFNRGLNQKVKFKMVPSDLTLNRDGILSEKEFEIEKPPGVFRILLVGSSHLAISWNSGIAGQLQKILGEKIQNIEIINCSVIGASIFNSYWVYKNRCSKYKDVDFVLLQATFGLGFFPTSTNVSMSNAYFDPSCKTQVFNEKPPKQVYPTVTFMGFNSHLLRFLQHRVTSVDQIFSWTQRFEDFQSNSYQVDKYTECYENFFEEAKSNQSAAYAIILPQYFITHYLSAIQKSQIDCNEFTRLKFVEHLVGNEPCKDFIERIAQSRQTLLEEIEGYPVRSFLDDFVNSENEVNPEMFIAPRDYFHLSPKGYELVARHVADVIMRHKTTLK